MKTSKNDSQLEASQGSSAVAITDDLNMVGRERDYIREKYFWRREGTGRGVGAVESPPRAKNPNTKPRIRANFNTTNEESCPPERLRQRNKNYLAERKKRQSILQIIEELLEATCL